MLDRPVQQALPDAKFAGLSRGLPALQCDHAYPERDVNDPPERQPAHSGAPVGLHLPVSQCGGRGSVDRQHHAGRSREVPGPVADAPNAAHDQLMRLGGQVLTLVDVHRSCHVVLRLSADEDWGTSAWAGVTPSLAGAQRLGSSSRPPVASCGPSPLRDKLILYSSMRGWRRRRCARMLRISPAIAALSLAKAPASSLASLCALRITTADPSRSTTSVPILARHCGADPRRASVAAC